MAVYATAKAGRKSADPSWGHCMQDRLLQEQQALKDRLKKAVELHLHPKTSVDTATIADKVISMFDDMLQVMSGQAALAALLQQ